MWIRLRLLANCWLARPFVFEFRLYVSLGEYPSTPMRWHVSLKWLRPKQRREGETNCDMSSSTDNSSNCGNRPTSSIKEMCTKVMLVQQKPVFLVQNNMMWCRAAMTCGHVPHYLFGSLMGPAVRQRSPTLASNNNTENNNSNTEHAPKPYPTWSRCGGLDVTLFSATSGPK